MAAGIKASSDGLFGTLQVNGADIVTFNESGNLGLGVTPSAWAGFPVLQIKNGAIYGAGTTDFGSVQNGYFSSGWKYIASSVPAALYSQSSGVHAWSNAPSGTAGNPITFTQAMTLDASGNLLVGATSQTGTGKFTVKATSANNVADFQNFDNVGRGIVFYNSSGTGVGSISWTASVTTYATSSDYRLKDTIVPMTGALATVTALKPCTYKWKVDGSDGQGFIAHELQAVCPSAVTGEKDAVDADGNPQYQGIDTSFLVATLTAAIQEQQTTITALTARITALERA